MQAFLEHMTLAVEHDPTGPLVFVRLPFTDEEVSLNDAYDGFGPLALLHFTDGREAIQLPVDYDHLDGVAVYRVTTDLGSLIFPARIVPVLPRHEPTHANSRPFANAPVLR